MKKDPFFCIYLGMRLWPALLIFFLFSTFAESQETPEKWIQPLSPKEQDPSKLEEVEKIQNLKRQPKYFYTYIDREHSYQESAKLIGVTYALSWGLYPLTQPKVFKENGSWHEYKKNFGDLVFDKDEPFWNWVVHPISGSQLFLFYRANGYSRANALAMSMIASTLFEFTVEVYTEPASVQDLYQTPVLGAMLGVTLENLSLYLLNTGNAFGKILGHILNPMTLFWFYEGKIRLSPHLDGKGTVGLNLQVDF